jgi:hypothetical protein
VEPELQCSGLRLNVIVAGLLATLAAAKADEPKAPVFPPSIDADGQRLIQNGLGKRQAFFVDLYTCALYLPRPSSEIDYVLDESTPVSIVIQVHGRPPDTIPQDWAQTLKAELSDRLFARARKVYGDLQSNDVIHLLDAPGLGTSVRLNGDFLFTGPGRDLVDALITEWLIEPSAPHKLLQSLLGNP